MEWCRDTGGVSRTVWPRVTVLSSLRVVFAARGSRSERRPWGVCAPWGVVPQCRGSTRKGNGKRSALGKCPVWDTARGTRSFVRVACRSAVSPMVRDGVRDGGYGSESSLVGLGMFRPDDWVNFAMANVYAPRATLIGMSFAMKAIFSCGSGTDVGGSFVITLNGVSG